MAPFTEQDFRDLSERISRKARKEWKDLADKALRIFENAPTTRYEDVSCSYKALLSAKNEADARAWDFHEDTESHYVKILAALSVVEAKLL